MNSACPAQEHRTSGTGSAAQSRSAWPQPCVGVARTSRAMTEEEGGPFAERCSSSSLPPIQQPGEANMIQGKPFSSPFGAGSGADRLVAGDVAVDVHHAHPRHGQGRHQAAGRAVSACSARCRTQARAAADNYNHLMEQPTIFYALAAPDLSAGAADPADGGAGVAHGRPARDPQSGAGDRQHRAAAVPVFRPVDDRADGVDGVRGVGRDRLAPSGTCTSVRVLGSQSFPSAQLFTSWWAMASAGGAKQPSKPPLINWIRLLAGEPADGLQLGLVGPGRRRLPTSAIRTDHQRAGIGRGWVEW